MSARGLNLCSLISLGIRTCALDPMTRRCERLGFFPVALHVLDDEFFPIVGPEAQNREIIDDTLILEFDHRIPLLPGLSDVLFDKTYTPRHSGVVVDDDEDVSEACSQCCTGTLQEVHMQHFHWSF